MKKVKELSFDYIQKNLKGHIVHFKSDCEIFPLDIKGKILSVNINNTEVLMKTRVIPKNKVITVGSNMKNLRVEILD